MNHNNYHRPGLQQEIIKAAVKQIDEAGHNTVSIRKLSALLEVSPMAIYHYYPNKQALLSQLAETFRAELDASTSKNRDDSLNANEALINMGLGYIQYAILNEHRFSLMFNPSYALTPTEMFEQQPVLFNQFSRLVIELFDLKESAGAFLKVFSIWASVHGVAVLILAGPLRQLLSTPEEMNNFIEYHLEAILKI